MEIPGPSNMLGSDAWIDRVRAAARISRPYETARLEKGPARDFPVAPYEPPGLRGLEATQDLDVAEGKGRIVDIYL